MENTEENLDLNRLKEQWKNGFAHPAADPGHLPIRHLIQQNMHLQSSSAVKRLRRNLLIEILATIPMMVAIYVLLDRLGRHLPVLIWIVLLALTFGYHVFLYWKLSRNAPTMEENLAETLKTQVKEVGQFVRMYTVLSYVFGVFLFAVAVLNAYLHSPNYATMAINAMLGVFAGLGAFMSVKWYSTQLYGQHYETLAACYREFME